MLNRTILILCIFMLSGCVPTNLKPIKYSGSVVQKSNLPAYVQANSGRVKGYSSSSLVYAGGIFIPITSGPVPALQFGEKDQNVLIESLKTELLNNKIIGSLSQKNAINNVQITINFVQTEHFPDLQEYKITSIMHLKYGKKESSKKYTVLSSEGDSTWTKLNTSAFEGKTKVATKLIALLIPDIQKFISTVR